jgi:hypothetical protein
LCKVFVFKRHANNSEKKKKRANQKRYSAPPLSLDQTKNRFRSPFVAPVSPTIENGTNGNHSEEYESPEKVEKFLINLCFIVFYYNQTPEPTATSRSFRDASGKIRFLCSNPSCNSRLIRRADIFCKRYLNLSPNKIYSNNKSRHQLDFQVKDIDNSVQLITTNDSINHDRGRIILFCLFN